MSPPSPAHEHHAKPLMLRCLGGLSLENGGRPIVGAGNQPQRLAILSVIARGAQRGVSRDRLQAMFWPDSDTERARGALNQALYALRRDVGEREFILGTLTVRLNPDAITCDAGEFERALDDGAAEAAVRLYRGPFLDGVHVDATAEFESWAESQRGRLAQRYVLALEQLARGASDREDLAAALDWWRRLCEVDPLNSKSALGLVQALAASGDRAGAVLHAARHQEALHAELDLPPDAVLAAFVTRLRTALKPGGHSVPGKPVDVGVRNAPPPAASAGVPAPAMHAEIPGRKAARQSRRLIGAAAALVVVLGAVWFTLARRADDVYAIGRATQLTFEPGLEIDPALSPDGRSVAYTAGSLSYMRIYVRQAGGRAVRVLGDSSPGQRRPLWSPDGTQLLYLHGRSTQNLSLVPALGGTPRLIAPGYVTSAAWAPDGRRVAYVRKDTLYVQSIDGGDARVIVYYSAMYALAWSPDGRRIAFAAGNSKFAISDLSAFGTTGPSRILTIPADGGEPVAVTDLASQNVSPAWAPDSRRLLFISDRDGPRDVYVVRLGSSGAPEGPATRLTAGLSPHSISLSADGRRLAYSAFEQRSNIWAMPISPIALSQSAAVPITTGSQFIEDMSVSADGKRLYFDSGREGNADIYRMTLPDGDPVRLTRDPAGDYYPSESPDGRWIAFYSLRYGSRDIMVMPTDGGAPQRVTTDTLDELWPRWSPDSRSLIYALEDQSDRSGLNGMYVISRDTSGTWGQSRRVSLIANEPAWSPDGRTLLVAFDPVVWAIPADGGPQRQIYAPRPGTDDPGMEIAQWMPDGRTLVMKSHDENDLTSFWSMSVTGGRLRLLGRLEDPSRASPRDELATDGKRLYFTIHDRQSDIYVTELSGLR